MGLFPVHIGSFLVGLRTAQVPLSFAPALQPLVYIIGVYMFHEMLTITGNISLHEQRPRVQSPLILLKAEFTSPFVQ